jgi:hypothetical protein
MGQDLIGFDVAAEMIHEATRNPAHREDARIFAMARVGDRIMTLATPANVNVVLKAAGVFFGVALRTEAELAEYLSANLEGDQAHLVIVLGGKVATLALPGTVVSIAN